MVAVGICVAVAMGGAIWVGATIAGIRLGVITTAIGVSLPTNIFSVVAAARDPTGETCKFNDDVGVMGVRMKNVGVGVAVPPARAVCVSATRIFSTRCRAVALASDVAVGVCGVNVLWRMPEIAVVSSATLLWDGVLVSGFSWVELPKSTANASANANITTAIPATAISPRMLRSGCIR